MAVIEYDEYKQKLQALEPTLQDLEKARGIPKAREELAATIEKVKLIDRQAESDAGGQEKA